MRLLGTGPAAALRSHQRNPEYSVTDLSGEEVDWLERHAVAPEEAAAEAGAPGSS